MARSRSLAGTALKPRLDDAILDAAEMLFGREGLNGVSFRQIASAAGSSNHFAVQYYFKDKPTLVREIFLRRIPSLERRTSQLLSETVRAGRDRDVRALIGVQHLPIAEETDAEGRCSYAAFLLGLRMSGELPSQWDPLREAAPLIAHVVDRVRDCLGPMPEPLFLERMLAVSTVFLTAVVDSNRRGGGDSAGALGRALDFAAAGLMAPCR